MDIKSLLEIRKNVKKRKPCFIRQDAHKKVRVKDSWRRPKGWNSKMRQGLRGYRKCVTIGYKSPSAVRGLTRTGFQVAWVSRKEDLVSLEPKNQAIVITSGTGTRKKIGILEEAIKKGFKVINYKSAQEYLDKIKDELEKKRQLKKKAEEVKKEKEKEKEEASKKKEEEEKVQEEEKKKESDSKTLDDITEEEKKKQEEEKKKEEEEKKEKDKVLTKKS